MPPWARSFQGDGRHGDVQVDAIEQRARELARVANPVAGRAGAGMSWIAEEPAGARVHRRDEQHVAGKDGGRLRPDDREAPFFERLADRFERVAPKLRQLVEKEDPAVGQRSLAGRRPGASSHEARARDPVVGRAEGRRREEAGSRGQRSGDRVDPRDLEGFGRSERRENSGKPAGQHRLSRAGRPGQKEVVPAGSGDLGRAARDRLAPDFGEIRPGLAGRRGRGRRGGNGLRAGDVRDGGREVRDGNDADPLHRGGLRSVLRREDDLVEPGVAGRQGQAERAPNGPHLAAEPELADEDAPRAGFGPEALQAGEADGNGKIEGGARLTEVGRGEIDRDRAVRQREAAVLERRAHALAGLANARVGQTHDGEAGNARPRRRLPRRGRGRRDREWRRN